MKTPRLALCAIIASSALFSLAACTPSATTKVPAVAPSVDGQKMTPFKVSVKDPDDAIQRLAIFGIKAYWSDQENAVMVEADKEIRGARILISAKMLPYGEKAYGFLKEYHLAQTDSARQVQHRVELQELLSDTIAAMDNVEAAIVNITPPSRPYYYRFDKEDLRAKASVMVQTFDSNPLKHSQATAIAQLIAGSTETMQAENVLISDTSGRHYPFGRKDLDKADGTIDTHRANLEATESKVLLVLAMYYPMVACTLEYNEAGKIDFANSSLAISVSEAFGISEAKKLVLQEIVADATSLPKENITIIFTPAENR